MAFSVALSDTRDDSFAFSMQGEDVCERTNGKRHVFYILVCMRKLFLSILMPCVICVHFGQLVNHW